MRILVSLDFADQLTKRILAVARDTASVTASSVFLIHVAEPDPAFVGYEAGPQVVREQVAHEYREQHCMLQEHAEALRTAGIDTTALLLQGPIANTILAEARRLKADLIIMGTHGRSAVMDVLVGGISHAVLRHTTIPVLLVPLRKPEKE